MRKIGTVVAVSLTATVAVLGSKVRGGRASLDYAHDIAPIFARACADCHTGEKPRGGLRLDRPARLASVVAPGNSGGSELVRRLLGEGGDDRMPAGRAPLPAREIDLIRRWIDQGAFGLPAPVAPVAAAAPMHWAYRAPVRPQLPAVRDTAWPRNEIDRFVLARLEQAGLAPAPEADPAALLRRVTLDLTGLPPTPAEIDAFFDDRARAAGSRAALDAAYERVVDRLLASPHFGERWAVPWLDVARYADSNGYEKDATRSIWRYRDWVVDALNDDMPFDRFTLEQLAGDLLPSATVAQRVATGFHRNTMFNEEGGVDPEEARFERMCDRAATTATVWLGSTLGCARCHDHKHDPFSQRDFYGLLAFFDGAREDTLPLPTAAEARRLEEIRAARAPLERALAAWTPALGEAQRRWESELLALPARFHPLAIASLTSSSGASLATQADDSILVEGSDPAGDAARKVCPLPSPPPRTGEGTRNACGDRNVASASHPLLRSAAGEGRGEGRPCERARLGGARGRDRDRHQPARATDRGSSRGAARCALAGRWAWARSRRRILPDGRRSGSRARRRRDRAVAIRRDRKRGRRRPPARGARALRGREPARERAGGRRARRRRDARLGREPHLRRRPAAAPAAGAGRRAAVRFPGGTRVRVHLRYAAAAQGEVIGRFRVSATDIEAPAAIAALPARLLRVVATPEGARARADGNELAQAFRQLTPLLGR